jgi:HEAT repeat protein
MADQPDDTKTPEPQSQSLTTPAEAQAAMMAQLVKAVEAATVAGLMQDLESTAEDNDDRRANAAYVLGQMGDAHAVGPLIDALRDEDTVVRVEAAAALGGLGDGAAVEPLIRALYDAQWEVRSNAALSLGALGDAAAIPHLIDLLADPHPEVRFWTARSLGDLRARAALPALRALLADPAVTPEGAVRDAAAQTIAAIEA